MSPSSVSLLLSTELMLSQQGKLSFLLIPFRNAMFLPFDPMLGEFAPLHCPARCPPVDALSVTACL